MRPFRLLIIGTVIFSSMFVLLIAVVQLNARGLPHHVLAYTQVGGIGLMDADRRLSIWLSPNKLDSVRSLQWSPNGDEIAFVDYLNAMGTKLHILSLEDLSVKELHSGENSVDPNWSPDGHLLVFATAAQTASELRVIDVSNGNILDYLTQPDAYGPVWSPNGQMIAFASGNEMRVMDANSGQVISDLTQPIYDGYPRFWRWSPDGRWLVFASFQEQDIFRITLSVIDLNNHEVRTLFSPIDFSTSPPIWSPDSQHIAFSTVQPISPSKSTEVVHIFNLFTGEDSVFAPQGVNGSYFVQDWSSDGQWVLFLDVENHVIYGINRSDNQPQILVPANYQPTSIQVASDGQQLAFTSSIPGTYPLFILDMKTHLIAHLADYVSSPVWQP
jgi:Tol biopolymer transport system component